MRTITEPAERLIVLFAAILLVLIVDVLKPSPSSPDAIHIEMTILDAVKRSDHSIDVTVEIANRSRAALADNRLFVVPMPKDGHTGGGGTAAADDPLRDAPVRELEGAFDPIPPKSSVTVAITVPSGTADRKSLAVLFQSAKIRYANTEETRLISTTEPLPIPD